MRCSPRETRPRSRRPELAARLPLAGRFRRLLQEEHASGMIGKRESGELGASSFRASAARALSNASAFALVSVLPVLMVASNRSTALVVIVSAALALAALLV